MRCLARAALVLVLAPAPSSAAWWWSGPAQAAGPGLLVLPLPQSASLYPGEQRQGVAGVTLLALSNVAAVHRDQWCGTGARRTACGERALAAVRGWLQAGPVVCRLRPGALQQAVLSSAWLAERGEPYPPQGGQPVRVRAGHCALATGDLGAMLVAAGYALARSPFLAEAERNARDAGRGGHQGGFAHPDRWQSRRLTLLARQRRS